MLVTGVGVTSDSVVPALARLGAEVVVFERSKTSNWGAANKWLEDSGRLPALRAAGATVLLDSSDDLPPGIDVVVTSPGWPPSDPLLGSARAAGLEVFSEPELAWRVRPPSAAPWLAVTGTNGKTTTTLMLAGMLAAANLRTVAAGNIGTRNLIDVVLGDDVYDAVAVELSSFQLEWSSTLAPLAGAVLNLAEDHLDWHGGFDPYAAAKAKLWTSPETIAIGNLDDPRVAAMLAGAAGRKVGFRLGPPEPGELGVVGDVLVDRAFGHSVVLAHVSDVRPVGPHNVANALAAAALARAYGVAPDAVAAGLQSYTPAAHRSRDLGVVDGVRYVDDSKATNPHATVAALRAYDRVTWIAGGMLKIDPDPLVETVADVLGAAVLLGRDRDALAIAIRKFAPDVPVVRVGDGPEDEVRVPSAGRSKAEYAADVMTAAVRAAASAAGRAVGGGEAEPTVLLAPAADSRDMFQDYADRGDAFAAAVESLR
ncbi:UDP-N-acetylmuramoyl-L-alanine--D-glutamate ligase [Cryptosporangium phraense]|uniref:UDP-N-acetylmuramoyl-L-alanine--D-glutamate ligase n=1 Tax=Cryptosporangium phraense TaxID=2593070 RepID=UPI001F0F7851|nr:UDP-N-acetylmuramoyl-L-alanine--D-glutamate ligase [Cryptosporangium phraense]